MKKSESKMLKYYAKGHYKGFYPKEGEKHFKKLGDEIHITFTNGEKELTASGEFREQALKDIFKSIDDYKEEKPKAVTK